MPLVNSDCMFTNIATLFDFVSAPNYMIFRLYLILILATNSQCKRTESNTITDIDGNIYSTTLIGDYRWMTENLKTTRLNDGSAIPCVKDQSIWLRSDTSAYCYYQNNVNYADTLGFLYNWYAVNSGKLCPTGWKIPSDNDWIQIAGGSSGFWWTSTEASASSAYYRSLIYSFEQVARDTHPKRMGFSVRCIKNK